MTEATLLLGGSFDPVHIGHLESIDALRKKIRLSKALLLPAKLSPLKTATCVEDTHRLAILKYAIADYPALQIDAREIVRRECSYTLMTLKEMRRELPDDSLIFAMGMDSLLTLHLWHGWQSLCELAHLAIFSRPGYTNRPSLVVQNWLQDYLSETPQPLLRRPFGRVWITELPYYQVSSSELRQAIYNGNQKFLKQFLCPSVLRYIQQNSLYGL